jgi:hypothetical protein
VQRHCRQPCCQLIYPANVKPDVQTVHDNAHYL